MRNRSCRHAYSKAAILEHVRRSKGSATCPVAGCSSKVTARSLEAAPDLAKQVVEEQRRRHAAEQGEGRREGEAGHEEEDDVMLL